MLKFVGIFNNVKINITIFNRYFMKNQIKVGDLITLKGKYKEKFNNFSCSEVYVEPLIQPRYVLKYKLSKNKVTFPSDKFSNLLEQILEDKNNVIEYLSDEIREKYKLVSRYEALREIHFPSSDEGVFQAMRYLKFCELYLYFIQIENLISSKSKRERLIGNIDFIDSDIKDIGFDLTSKQTEAIIDCISDLNLDTATSRLIQGDVGSGKTIVVEMVMKYVTKFGKQAILIAPTTIVAAQHFEEIKQRFPNLRVLHVNSKTLNSGLVKTINSGDFDLLVGTTSILSKKLVLEKLDVTLVVVDEQHRFGVAQRLKLEQRLPSVNSIYLSATPIPRTLSLSILGYLNTTIIDEYPKSRKEIFTKVIEQEEDAFDLVANEISKNNKVYVVVSKIESEDELTSIVGVAKKYQSYFKDAKIGVLHSKLSVEEKDDIFEKFASGWFDILIATTIVEVGVNNVDATTIIIKDAKNFGVSQLHQLRGRVGRGSKQSYAFLVDDGLDDIVTKRLNAICDSSDGFELANFDLENRGGGSLMSFRQSGDSDFKLVRLTNSKDQVIAKYAKKEAVATLENKQKTDIEKYVIDMCLSNEVTHLN